MATISQRKKIIAVLDDLFFASKLREAAKPLEAELEITKSAEGLIQKIKSEKPSLIIFDLNSKACSPLEIIRQLKSSSELKEVPILGYLSHVQTELKDEADKAGCNVVLPRSKFSRDMREILLKYSIQG